ncbi:hypothetical protein L2E82_14224 [Cichorium intybus]|uniref:Uncharacterized protein n=1 Tax=Cichorium intybus TaxID=13427 RepID=A0ACB9EZI3_CICIN|nr:hypothetical protein L2E82_14224 [Cichorium intybus]
MEMLPVKPTKNCTRKKHTNKLKVVYISSPMKVKTSASRFRALVQELTGRDSDISRYDVANFDPVAPTVTTTTNTHDGAVDVKAIECGDQQGMHFTGSESFLDDLFGVDKLEGMFPLYSSYESCLQ